MLAFNVDAWSQGWFHAKLALVIALNASAYAVKETAQRRYG